MIPGLFGLFFDAAAKWPANPAVVDGEAELSYAALLSRSVRAGRALGALPVAPGAAVGVALRRTGRAAVAALGVLAAGAVYLPLDPAAPASRRRFVMRDAAAATVIVEDDDEDEAWRLEGVRAVPFSELRAGGDGQGEPMLSPCSPSAASGCYLTYTSGSTGQPKGVLVPHTAVIHVLRQTGALFGIDATTTLVHVVPFTFDVSIASFFLPLLTGGCVVVAPEEALRCGALLWDVAARRAATACIATPATWFMLLAAGWQPPPRFLAVTTGEALPQSLARSLCAAGEGGLAVWNAYGPTETAIWATARQVAADDVANIGGPLPGVTALVVADGEAAAPVDCGEGREGGLWVGGPGLAVGYLNQPELTATRFVMHPVTGERFYRTGDLVRRRAGGELEYVGRLDAQLKVHGVRIEAAEVEGAMEAAGTVRQAVVLALGTEVSDRQLVAVCVPAVDQSVDDEVVEAPEADGTAFEVERVLALEPDCVVQWHPRQPALMQRLAPLVDRYALLCATEAAAVQCRGWPGPPSVEVAVAGCGGGALDSSVVLGDAVVLRMADLPASLELVEHHLRQAYCLVRPGGCLLLAGVSHSPALHFARCHGDLPARQLAVDPLYFIALKEALAPCPRVEVQPRGNPPRLYDVYYYHPAFPPPSSLNDGGRPLSLTAHVAQWGSGTTFASLRRLLRQRSLPYLVIAHVPLSSPTWPDGKRTPGQSAPPNPPAPAAEGQPEPPEGPPDAGSGATTAATPAVFHSLAQREGYRCEVAWSPGSPVRFDVLLVRQDVVLDCSLTEAQACTHGAIQPTAWPGYSTRPLRIAAEGWCTAARAALLTTLPASHCPAAFFFAAPPLPTTAAGKLDRAAVQRAAEAARAAGRARLRSTPLTAAPGAGVDAIAGFLSAAIAHHLGFEPGQDTSFQSLGLSSAALCRLAGDLTAHLDRPVSPALFFCHPTVRQLATALCGPQAHADLVRPPPTLGPVPTKQKAAAIVGWGCRLPGGVASPADFWQLLITRGQTIGPLPAHRAAEPAWQGAPPGPPAGYVGAFLSDDVCDFDADFFGIPAAEACAMDPQQRLLLQVAFHALEDAGRPPATPAAAPSGLGVVVAGSPAPEPPEGATAPSSPYAVGGRLTAALANRVSHWLDARGPSLVVDTASSGALVAVHLGLQALHTGQCSAALVGGVNLILGPALHLALDKLGVLSPDGTCRTFDARANGMVRGEGALMALLELQSDDPGAVCAVPYATIVGSCVSHTGRGAGTLTAPTVPAVEQAISGALRDAGVAPGEVQHVECHGTGTQLGDAVECHGTAAALRGAPRPALPPLGLGSAKPNVGHTEAAAGLVGVLKVALALARRRVPPTLADPRRLTPHVAFAALGLRVVAEPEDWAGPAARYGGVTALGLAGTGAHAVLSGAGEPAELVEAADDAEPQLLCLAAPDVEALQQLAARYAALLRAGPPPGQPPRRWLAAVCRAAARREAAGRCRTFAVAETPALMAEQLLRGFPAHCAYAPDAAPDIVCVHADVVLGRRSGTKAEAGPGGWAGVLEVLGRYGVRPRAVLGVGDGCAAAAKALGADLNGHNGSSQCTLKGKEAWAGLLGDPFGPAAWTAGTVATAISWLTDRLPRPLWVCLGPDFPKALAVLTVEEPGLALLDFGPLGFEPSGVGFGAAPLAGRHPVLHVPLPASANPCLSSLMLAGHLFVRGVALDFPPAGGAPPLLWLPPLPFRRGPPHSPSLSPPDPASASPARRTAGPGPGLAYALGLAVCAVRHGPAAPGAVVLRDVRLVVGGPRAEGGAGPSGLGDDGRVVVSVDGEAGELVTLQGTVLPWSSCGRFLLPTVPDLTAIQNASPVEEAGQSLWLQGSEAYCVLPGTTLRPRRGDQPSPLAVLLAVLRQALAGPVAVQRIGGVLDCPTAAERLHVYCRWRRAPTGAAEAVLAECVAWGEPDAAVAFAAWEVAVTPAGPAEVTPGGGPEPPAEDLPRLVRRVIAAVVGAEVGDTVGLLDAGLDSLQAVDVRNRLAAALGRPLPATLVFDCGTADGVVAYLSRAPAHRPAPLAAAPPPAASLAVAGMACRLPGGLDSPEALWAALGRGIDAVGEVPLERFDIDAWYAAGDEAGTVYTRAGAFLTDLDLFDYKQFGISELEAQCMVPEQRVLLEVAFDALHNAQGSPGMQTSPSVGTFIGGNAYYVGVAAALPPETVHTDSGAAFAITANRVAYALALRGPAVMVDTACSASLVAMHMGVRSVQAGDCAAALVGGVNALAAVSGWTWLARTGALSRSGRCRTFDAAADGYVRGEGCAALLLSSEAANPAVRCLGSAVNQCGRTAALTAPSGPAQQAVIRAAWGPARGGPRGTFVECHGTGTALGDPIEVGALLGATDVLSPGGGPLVLGAIKTNLGHLEAAAGIAGALKAILVLHHRQVPPNLHLQGLNPHLAELAPALLLPTAALPLPGPTDAPALAGCSSFGFGGTNAHVVLQAPGADTTVGRHSGPRYRFRRQCLICPKAKAHALALEHSADGAVIARVRGRLLRTLQDHQVHSRPVWPAAALLELAAVAAVRQAPHSGPGATAARRCELRDVRLLRPLFVPAPAAAAGEGEGGAVECRVVEGTVRVEAAGQLHFTCKVQATNMDAHEPAADWFAAAQARCPQPADVPALYARLAAAGFEYGPQFRTLTEAWVGAGEAVGVVAAPAGAADYFVHPGVLDGAFHVTDLCCPGGMPVRVASMVTTLTRAHTGSLWVYVRHTGTQGATSTCDVWLLDEALRPVVAIQGLQQLSAGSTAEETAPTEALDPEDALYEEVWVPGPSCAPIAAPAPCVVLAAAPACPVAAELGRRLGAVRGSIATLPTTARAIVYLAEDRPAATADPTHRLSEGLELLQRVTAAASAPPLLLVVTREAQAVAASDMPRPWAAGLWALCRSARAEYPDLPLVCLDVSGDATSAAVAAAAVWALLCRGPEVELAARRGRLLCRRLRRPPQLRAASPPGLLPTPAAVGRPGCVEVQVAAVGLPLRLALDVLLDRRDPGGALAMLDFAGTVLAPATGIGGSGGLLPGARVFGVATAALQARLWVPADQVAETPPGLPLVDAAALPMPYLMAHQALQAVPELCANSCLLVHPWPTSLSLALQHSASARGLVVCAVVSGQVVELAPNGPLRPLDATAGLDAAVVFRAALGDRLPPVAVVVLAGQGNTGRCALPAAQEHRWLPGLDPSGCHGILQRIAEGVAAGRYRPLPRHVRPFAGDAAAALRWAVRGRPPARAVLRWPPPPEGAEGRLAGTYLVTGGLGGLGLVTAGWLAAQGADRIVLIGRRAAPAPEAADWHQRLLASGVRVDVERCDVARLQDVAEVVARVQQAGPPLRGVVHSAGVLADGLLAKQSPQSLRAVWDAKVTGAVHLQRCTTTAPLRCLVLFSSIAAAVGAAGQANYAAANAALDAYGRRWRRAGCPALAVQWNSWAEVGMAARTRTVAAVERLGYHAITPATGLAALAWVLRRPALPVLLVCPHAADHVPEELRGLLVGYSSTATAATHPGRGTAPPPTAATREALRGLLRQLVAETCGEPAPGDDAPLGAAGMDSLSAMEFRRRLQTAVGRPLPPALVYDYPTVAALLDLLCPAAPAPAAAASPDLGLGVAAGEGPPMAAAVCDVVGLDCWVAEAEGPDALWSLLNSLTDTVQEIPLQRFDVDSLDSASPSELEMYVRHASFLTGLEFFDATFFGLRPPELAAMALEHRVLLQVGYGALHRAGLSQPALMDTPVGVFVGHSGPIEEPQAEALARGPAFLAGRLSFTLGLVGPSVVVDTACSAALSAVSWARQSLLARECPLALVVGVNLLLRPAEFVVLCRLNVLSHDGRCHTFDEAASGYGRGEGSVAAVLRRRPTTEPAAGCAVLRGAGLNQDGRSASLTAPRAASQTALIQAVMRQAGVSPSEIAGVEAHGSATPLGDALELQGLRAALHADGRPPLRLTCVKPRLGHLEGCAGLAGLAAAVLQLQRCTTAPLPAGRLQRVSPQLPLEGFAALFPTAPGLALPPAALLGVSSFGISGTNAHALLQAATDGASSTWGPAPAYQRQYHPLRRRHHAFFDPAGAAPAPTAAVAYALRGPRLWRLLADHRVAGAAVWPAAAVLEAGWAAAARAEPGQPGSRLEAVRFEAFLPAQEWPAKDPADVLLTVAGDHFAITCNSVRHAGGRLCPASPTFPLLGTEWVAGAEARCRQPVDVPALYARLAAAGFTYGPQFRTLTEAWVGAGEAVGVVAAPAGAADYFVHPGVLDGAFHLTDLCCSGGGVPVAVASATAMARPLLGPRLRVHVRRVVRAGGGEVACEVAVVDGTGLVAVHLTGLALAHSAATPQQYRLAVPAWAPLQCAADAGSLCQRCAVVGERGGPVANLLRTRLAEVPGEAVGCLRGPTGVVSLAANATLEAVTQLMQTAPPEADLRVVVVRRLADPLPDAICRPASYLEVDAEAPAEATADAVVALLQQPRPTRWRLRGRQLLAPLLRTVPSSPPHHVPAVADGRPAAVAVPLPAPPPGPHELRVAVRAVALSVADALAALGLRGGGGKEAMGRGFAGVVVGAGEAVPGLPVGADVYGVAPAGLQPHVRCRWHTAARMPRAVDHAAAAVLPSPVLAALRLLPNGPPLPPSPAPAPSQDLAATTHRLPNGARPARSPPVPGDWITAEPADSGPSAAEAAVHDALAALAEGCEAERPPVPPHRDFDVSCQLWDAFRWTLRRRSGDPRAVVTFPPRDGAAVWPASGSVEALEPSNTFVVTNDDSALGRLCLQWLATARPEATVVVQQQPGNSPSPGDRTAAPLANGCVDGPSRRAEAAAAGHTVLHTAGPGEDWRPSLHRREADAPGEGPVHVYFAASGAEGCADRPWLPASGSREASGLWPFGGLLPPWAGVGAVETSPAVIVCVPPPSAAVVAHALPAACAAAALAAALRTTVYCLPAPAPPPPPPLPGPGPSPPAACLLAENEGPLPQDGATPSPGAASKARLEATLRDIVAPLTAAAVSAHTPLVDLGLDSLDLLRLQHTLRVRAGLAVPLPALMAGTVADLAARYAPAGA